MNRRLVARVQTLLARRRLLTSRELARQEREARASLGYPCATSPSIRPIGPGWLERLGEVSNEMRPAAARPNGARTEPVFDDVKSTAD